MSEIVIPIGAERIQGEIFSTDEYNYCYSSLQLCEAAGYQAQYIPALVRARILSVDSPLWGLDINTPSTVATGKTTPSNISRKGGNRVDIYFHL